MSSTDPIVEDKGEKHPGYIVKWRCRGDESCTRKDDREVDVLEGAYFELLVDYPLDQWCKGAEKEEEHEAVIELTIGEQSLWSDDTPL